MDGQWMTLKVGVGNFYGLYVNVQQSHIVLLIHSLHAHSGVRFLT